MSNPARGRRIGIRMLEMYTDQLNSIFEGSKSALETRKEKKIEDLRDAVHQEVGRDEVLKKLTDLLDEAHQKHCDSEKLAEEASELRDKAKTIAAVTKVINPNSVPEYGNYQRVEDMTFEDSDDVESLLRLCIMAQTETLDIMELSFRLKESKDKLNMCVTMEQCVEVLEEAKKNAADL